jgi:ATP phosphoribosyltransferase regulatory subunit
MSKFETYDIYNRHRNFIDGAGVVTFTDTDGRLMALKPDVTLSIAAGAGDVESEKKVYYFESIFRRDRNGELKELPQTGIECIGGDSAYAVYEAVSLALRSLKAIGGETMLTVGNLDFAQSFPAFSVLSAAEKKQAVREIGAKNFHGLSELAARSGVAEAEVDALAAAVSLTGGAEEVLERARLLAKNEAGRLALADTAALFAALSAAGLGQSVNLDFSLTNDLSYYNGIVFQGYVRGLPRAVLSGGQYDNMMRRLGKSMPAVGFALQLGELARIFVSEAETDCDVLLEYGDAPLCEVIRASDKLVEKGLRVRCVKTDPGGIRYTEKTVLSAGKGRA